MIDPNPCQGCTERFTACYDRCPKDARGEFGHNAWLKQYHGQQKHFEDNRYRLYIPMSAAREKRTRNFAKYGSGSRAKGGDQ